MTSTVEREVSREEEFQDLLDEDRMGLIKRVIEESDEESVYILPKEVAREVLTEERMRIIETLREEEVSSKRDLARKLDRDIKNVSNDLDLLWKHSVIGYEKGEGNSKIPKLSADEIIVEPL